MTDEAQPSPEQEVAAIEPTIDDVINEFNIGNDEPQPVEQPTEQQFTPQTEIDPYDGRSIETFVDSKFSAQNQTLEQMRSQLDSMQNEKVEAQFQADVKQAVGVLTESIDGISEKHAKFLLEDRASEDSAFKAIWDNRHVKPQALDKALQILVKESKETFSMRSDPDLVENQRAMKQSMESNNNQPAYATDLEQRLEEAETLAERNRIRQEIASG